MARKCQQNLMTSPHFVPFVPFVAPLVAPLLLIHRFVLFVAPIA